MPAPTATRVRIDFAHHTVDDSEAKQMAELRARFADVANGLVEVVPDGREQQIALTKLEEALFWANAGIARARAHQSR